MTTPESPLHIELFLRSVEILRTGDLLDQTVVPQFCSGSHPLSFGEILLQDLNLIYKNVFSMWPKFNKPRVQTFMSK